VKLLLILIAGLALASEPAQPTDADKLKVREAQLAEMQTYWRYRAAIAELDRVHAATEAALAELAKLLNCTPDAQTLLCPAKN
jgi:hypothetical protein